MGHENFDSYLSKLQTLCGSGSDSGGYCDENNRPLYETVKSALQDFTVLPTPIWTPPPVWAQNNPPNHDYYYSRWDWPRHGISFYK